MLAENIMVTGLITSHADESVQEALDRMSAKQHRMLPVLTNEGVVVGVISTFSVLENIVPEYIVSGDLSQISYAPDMGILHKHYEEVALQKVSDMMDKKPLLVKRNESLLSVSAALTAFGKHEYALVVDDEERLLGIISAGDILERVNGLEASVENDA